MPYAVFNKETKILRAWHRHPPPPEHDPAAEVLVEVSGEVDHRTERWDGAGGVRPATQQEMDGFDAEERGSEFDGQKLLKALAIWTAGKLGVPPATARDEILAIYRGL